MMQRNMVEQAALRAAFQALQEGRFAAARDAAAGWAAGAPGALLHGLGQAGAGEAAGFAALAGIARANPGARHPALDLVELLRRHGGDEAAALRAALTHAPDDAGLLGAFGQCCAEGGSAAEAVALFRRAAAVAPSDGAAWANLGKAQAAVGEDAEAAFATAARLRPGDAQVALNWAVARLRAGRMAAGWGLFRARSALPGRGPGLPGEELRSLDGVAGRRVLLLHDEGFGDTLQFIRYAPMLAAAGAIVAVRAPEALRRVLEANGAAVVGEAARYDAWCRIPDLPGVFGTEVGTIPGGVPYLRADPGWRAPRLPDGFRAGLVWAGAGRVHDPAAMAVDRLRSIPVERLGGLLAVPGVAWVSLQLGRAAPDRVFDAMVEVADFADTAAIVAGLDVVVSVDTAVAHLAGGMGKRVILLDRFDHCWRWLRGREDSPWYPGRLRIIRQEAPGDWDGVLGRAAAMVSGMRDGARP